MGKNIDLKRQQQETKTRIPKPTSQQQSTTADPKSKNVPPIPVGAIISSDGKRLTEEEFVELQSVGWKPGDPVPDNMASLYQRLQAHVQQENDIPDLPLNLPPVKVPEPVDINKLPTQQQKEAREAILQLHQQEQSKKKTEQEQQRLGTLPESVQQAVNLANEATNKDRIEIVDDRGETDSNRNEPTIDTGLMKGAKICSHCGWDNTHPDTTEPKWIDKNIFAQSMAGRKQFVKEYELFGGSLRVAFRQLAPGEIDALSTYLYQQDLNGRFTTPAHLYEFANRMELFVQLVRFMPSEGGTIDLPEGISKKLNPTAQTFWEFENDVVDFSAIEQFMMSEIFTSTGLIHALALSFNEFKRFCVKMAAMSREASFWKATEEPR